MALFPSSANPLANPYSQQLADYLSSLSDAEFPGSGARLGNWWRLRLRGGFRWPPERLRPVIGDSLPGVASSPAAAPPALPQQLLGQFTTRRTQLFGPFATMF